jgi:protein involved in polysaccharide export with SLBB domain
VELYEEQYNISNAVILEDIEIFIVGVGKGADIVCTFHDSEERFSFLFARNKKLVLQNLQFANCPMPVLVEQAEHVEIRNSTFRYFTEAVFDIFNCHVVNILGCVFEHNRGSGQSTDSNRGNTGCLAIGYKDLNSSVNRLWVEIRDSVFRDNIATADVLDVRTQDTSRINLLGSNVYRGRGGAIGLFFHNINVTTLITGCSFVNNKAFYGGGVYIAYGGPSAQVSHKATIRGCDFFENEAEFGGAGILAAFRVSGNNNNPMITDIIDSNFTGNKAVEVAGGVGITVADSRTDEGVQARIQGCIFRGNEAGGFGSAVRFTVLNIFFERNAASAHEVINCTFLENSGPHGTLGVAHVPLRLSGNVIFENNTGHSLQVIGSIVTIDGDVRFVGNDARRDGGGALYISAFGQILMKENSNMLFENNNGSTGSAIVVSTQMISSTYSKLLFNTQCFLLYEDMARAPNNWSNVSIIFKGNLADLGADVFANSLETCAWFSFKAPFFDVTQFQNWTIFNQTADSIQTNPESVVIESEESVVQFSSGHPTSFNPVLRDQFGRGTVGTLQLVYTSDSNHVC